MKRIIIVIPLLLAISLIFLMLIVFKSNNNQQVYNISSEVNSSLNKPTSNQTASTLLSDSKNGVDLAIDNIKKENNQTIINLSINNHVYDLSQFDASKNSSLAGIKPSSYKIINSASGGHHVQSQIIFTGNLSGLLIIKLNDSLVFNFTI